MAKLGGVDAREAQSVIAQAKAEADRFRFSARAWRERAEAPPRTVEVVKEIKVPIEPPPEQRPATARQVTTLFDLARKRGLSLDPEAPMTVGTVGATIRRLLQPAENVPERKPSDRGVTPRPAPRTRRGLGL